MVLFYEWQVPFVIYSYKWLCFKTDPFHQSRSFRNPSSDTNKTLKMYSCSKLLPSFFFNLLTERSSFFEFHSETFSNRIFWKFHYQAWPTLLSPAVKNGICFYNFLVSCLNPLFNFLWAWKEKNEMGWFLCSFSLLSKLKRYGSLNCVFPFGKDVFSVGYFSFKLEEVKELLRYNWPFITALW